MTKARDSSFQMVTTYAGPMLLDINYRRKWMGERRVLTERHLPVMRSANLAATIVPLDSIDDLCALLLEVRESEGAFRVVRSRQELEAANRQGAIGLFLCASCNAVGGNLDLLALLEAVGVRMFALAYNPRNLLTDGCGEELDGGLSFLGRKAVKQMLDMNMLIDVSHTSDVGVEQVMALVNGPVIASHSNCRAICGNARNVTDAQIEAIAAKGGCVSPSVHPSLIDPGQEPTIDHYMTHLEHMLELVGDDHVSLGADFIDYEIDLMAPKLKAADPAGTIYHAKYVHVKGLEGLAQLPDVLRRLAAKGYSSATIRKVSYENALRLLG